MKTLVEEVARAICFERGGPACRCRKHGHCRAPIENLMHESNPLAYQARAAVRVAFPAIRDACAEKAAQAARTYDAEFVRASVRALTLDALPASPASGAAAEGGGWRPIENPPDHHLRRLIWAKGCPVTVGFLDVTGKWWPMPAEAPLGWTPTHWRPLPAPPQQQEQGGENG